VQSHYYKLERIRFIYSAIVNTLEWLPDLYRSDGNRVRGVALPARSTHRRNPPRRVARFGINFNSASWARGAAQPSNRGEPVSSHLLRNYRGGTQEARLLSELLDRYPNETPLPLILSLSPRIAQYGRAFANMRKWGWNFPSPRTEIANGERHTFYSVLLPWPDPSSVPLCVKDLASRMSGIRPKSLSLFPEVSA
jgi:hypothetical protein